VTQPEVVHYLPWLGPVARQDNLQSALATAIAPALASVLFVWISLAAIRKAARYSGAVSVSVARLKAFKAVFWVLVIVAGIWVVAVGALIVGASGLDDGRSTTSKIANGSVTTAIFLFIILLNIAVIAPGLLLLQPVRLWKSWKAKKRARTPRQLFRGQWSSGR
jgi:TRAP-type C4-dicarboxylate transport system permease small subunit